MPAAGMALYTGGSANSKPALLSASSAHGAGFELAICAQLQLVRLGAKLLLPSGHRGKVCVSLVLLVSQVMCCHMQCQHHHAGSDGKHTLGASIESGLLFSCREREGPTGRRAD